MNIKKNFLGNTHLMLMLAVSLSVLVNQAYAGECIIKVQQLSFKEKKSHKNKVESYFKDIANVEVFSEKSREACRDHARTSYSDQLQQAPFSRVIVKYVPERSECNEKHLSEEVCKHLDDGYFYNEDFLYADRYQSEESTVPRLAKVEDLYLCGLTPTQRDEFDNNETFANSSFLNNDQDKVVYFVSRDLKIYHHTLLNARIANNPEMSNSEALNTMFSDSKLQGSAMICQALAEKYKIDVGHNVQWEMISWGINLNKKKTTGVVK